MGFFKRTNLNERKMEIEKNDDLVLRRTTELQEQRQARNAEISAEWEELRRIPGQSRGEIARYLAKKYGLVSPSSVYEILRQQRKEGGAV